MQKSGHLIPANIRSLAIWKVENPKETTIGTCNQLEYPARRDLIGMNSHARPDTTEILLGQMKITA